MKVSSRDNWESFWQKKDDTERVYSNSDRIYRQIAKHARLHGKKILEVGAGTGRDSFFFAQNDVSLFLLDYSKQSLAIIKHGLPANAQAYPVGGDAFRLPFPSDSFDIVFHQGLLEHFRKPQARLLLIENVRVLKPDGLLIVDVPQRWHVYTAIKHTLIAFNKWFAGWEREFSVRELKQDLSALDMEIIDAYGEWMYPSLMYRMTREALMKLGITLPLYPRFSKFTSNVRAKIRAMFDGNLIQLYSALSIGVIARKRNSIN
jgi:ubiquinone/menaquinone biosynthesis C-methylase UbiE